MSEQKDSIFFGSYFNVKMSLIQLHPQDAFFHVEYLTGALVCFTEAFKERIEAEIDYSRAILKVSKKVEKYINPD
jgi:hypothetical protein